MSIREAFRQYEISLGGIIKNTYALGKIMKFATKYAAEYPAMFEEVLDTFRGLAALPALKPMFRRADERDLKKIMNIIQGLATLDPFQGVKGAGIALREALSGDMRSVRRRFEISAHAIAEAGGFALEEITQDSEKALKAFDAFIKLNVPAKSMADAAMIIGIQVGNLKDKYRAFVNDIMKSTGAYFSVVTALSDLNSWLTKVFASPIIKEWATAAGKHIRAFVETLKMVLSTVNWDKYLKSGDLLGGIVESIQKVTLLFKTVVKQWTTPFLTFVKKVAVVLWEGLVPVVTEAIKAMGGLFLVGMVETGKMAAIGFANGFMQKLSYVLGWLAGTISGHGAEMGKATEDAYNTAVARFGQEKKGLSISAGAEWDEGGFKDKIRKAYQDSMAENKPEIVTPEAPIEGQKLHIEHLRKELAASEALGVSEQRRKANIHALEEAEKSLARAMRIKNWEADQGIGRGETLKQMEEIEVAILKAAKAGKTLGADVYLQKARLQTSLDIYDEQYDKIVEQKSAIGDLLAAIKTVPGDLKKWVEQYKLGKTEAGGLLLVVQKLYDIATGKTETTASGILALLKERVKLTDAVIQKEKEYKKQIAATTVAIAQNVVELASGLQSSILSFAGKLKDAFIGVGKYGGTEPDPELPLGRVSGRESKKAQRQAAEERAKKEKIAALKAAREKVFKEKVLLKIATEIMVPENLLGMGRKEMTYRDAMWREDGTKAPAYMDHMLTGIKEAMAIKKESPEMANVVKVLAGMRTTLLEQKIPFTKFRSEERAEIYAKMAGAQSDLMQATIQAASADMQTQKDQLAALQSTAASARIALDKSDAIRTAIDILIADGRKSPRVQVALGSIPESGNNKITGDNPSVGAD
jgi:hypothetical protein